MGHRTNRELQSRIGRRSWRHAGCFTWNQIVLEIRQASSSDLQSDYQQSRWDPFGGYLPGSAQNIEHGHLRGVSISQLRKVPIAQSDSMFRSAKCGPSRSSSRRLRSRISRKESTDMSIGEHRPPPNVVLDDGKLTWVLAPAYCHSRIGYQPLGRRPLAPATRATPAT